MLSNISARVLTVSHVFPRKVRHPNHFKTFRIEIGSGGAGSTLLVATFLILAEEALTVVNSRRKPVKAMKDYTTVNFGPIVGDKSVAHLNLLETASM